MEERGFGSRDHDGIMEKYIDFSYLICNLSIDFRMCMRSKLMSSAVDIVQLFLCDKLVTSRNERGHNMSLNMAVELHRQQA